MSDYNRGYLKGLVRKKLQGDNYFTDTDIEDALNESQDDLAIFTKANLTREALTLVAGQDLYDWPATALTIAGVNYNGIELDYMTNEEWRRRGGLSVSNQASLTAPGNYSTEGKQLIIFPTPGDPSATVLVFFVPKPTDMTDDADVPSVSRVFSKPWVHLALSNLLEGDAARLADATYHYDMYLKRRAENGVNENASRTRKFRNTYPKNIRM